MLIVSQLMRKLEHINIAKLGTINGTAIPWLPWFRVSRAF
jgi:hypothetical protein